MSRILFLADLNPNKLGSMEEHALFLSKELNSRGHVCYLAFTAEPDAAFRRLFTEAGARLVTFDCLHGVSVVKDAKRIWGAIASLYRVVRENRIDIVHINQAKLTKICFWGIFVTGAQIVFTNHDSGFPYPRKPLKNFVAKILHTYVTHRVSRYIAVSDFVRGRQRQTHYVDGVKSLTLYNGVNLERFIPGDMVAARKQLGLPLDSKILCSVAMLIPEKGLQHLIAAVAQLVHADDIKELLAVIVGEGSYRDELVRLAAEMGVTEQVLFLGRRNDVQTLVAAADVVVVPSTWQESFGLIIAEAMSGAKPVVASRTGGIPELIDDRSTGMLVEPGDPQELAQRIRELLENPDMRRSLGQAARDKAGRMFNLSRQVDSLVDLYEELLKKPSLISARILHVNQRRRHP